MRQALDTTSAAAIQAQIDALTLELIDLCDRYKSPASYTIPDTPNRMRHLQEQLNGADGHGGLWAKWRRAVALQSAGGHPRYLGPTDSKAHRSKRIV